MVSTSRFKMTAACRNKRKFQTIQKSEKRSSNSHQPSQRHSEKQSSNNNQCDVRNCKSNIRTNFQQKLKVLKNLLLIYKLKNHASFICWIFTTVVYLPYHEYAAQETNLRHPIERNNRRDARAIRHTDFHQVVTTRHFAQYFDFFYTFQFLIFFMTPPMRNRWRTFKDTELSVHWLSPQARQTD
jgi:hypothetical protein